MARTGVSFDEVKNTAITLLGRGQNPSVQRVREMLGTGSNSTIAQHLKRWQRELADIPKAALPPTIPEAVMAALEMFWRVATEQADAAYEALRKEANRQVVAAEQRCKDAVTELHCAQEKQGQLTRQLMEAKDTAQKLERRLLLEEERRSIAEQAIAAAEQQAAERISAFERLCHEAEQRAARLEASLSRAHEDSKRQLTDADQRLQYERKRGESNESRLMQIIDQARIEHQRERKNFAEKRQTWKDCEQKFLRQMEVLQEKTNRAEQTAAARNERERQLEQELAHSRESLRESAARQLQSIRLIEVLRGKLKNAAVEQRTLSKQLADFQKAAQAQEPSSPPA